MHSIRVNRIKCLDFNHSEKINLSIWEKKDSSFHFQQCQMKIYHNIWRFSTKKQQCSTVELTNKKLYSIKQKNQSKSQPYGFAKTKPFVSEWKGI